jgi:hypothetical protein
VFDVLLRFMRFSVMFGNLVLTNLKMYDYHLRDGIDSCRNVFLLLLKKIEISIKGTFSVTWICPICATCAKNNFIVNSLYDTRTLGRGTLCGAFAYVSVPTTSVPILESDGAHTHFRVGRGTHPF